MMQKLDQGRMFRLVLVEAQPCLLDLAKPQISRLRPRPF